MLNWKPLSLKWGLTESPTGKSRLELSIDQKLFTEIRASLSSLAPQSMSEVQIEVDEGLVLFLKLAPTAGAAETKVLLARPEVDRHVVTVVMDEEGSRKLHGLIERESHEIEFHRLSRLHFLSNLEMVWRIVSTER